MIRAMIEDGGSAYPYGVSEELGMSLRDWFAGMAMQGMFASDNQDWTMPKDAEPARARSAYAMADAMIAIRRE